MVVVWPAWQERHSWYRQQRRLEPNGAVDMAWVDENQERLIQLAIVNDEVQVPVQAGAAHQYRTTRSQLAVVLWAHNSIGCVLAEVPKEVATPAITSAPSAHPFCMKDGKSRQEMAHKNPSGYDSSLFTATRRAASIG